MSLPLKIDNRAKVPITNDFVKDEKDIENWNFCPLKKSCPYRMSTYVAGCKIPKIISKWCLCA